VQAAKLRKLTNDVVIRVYIRISYDIVKSRIKTVQLEGLAVLGGKKGLLL
jgi:hypothetical protein